VTLCLYGSAREPVIAIAGSVMAGISWIAALSNLNVSAQFALPEWVRARGLAVYVTTFFGTMTMGSAIWGEAARVAGLPVAHYLAAAGALLAIPLTRRWKVQTAAGIDLRSSMHWSAPVLTKEVENDAGPVLVTVEYRISPENRGPFLSALQRLARERRRDGAYAWGVYEDMAEQGRYLETFLVESWLEHLRRHERVTRADCIIVAVAPLSAVAGKDHPSHRSHAVFRGWWAQVRRVAAVRGESRCRYIGRSRAAARPPWSVGGVVDVTR
jgi:hypothetical protein